VCNTGAPWPQTDTVEVLVLSVQFEILQFKDHMKKQGYQTQGAGQVHAVTQDMNLELEELATKMSTVNKVATIQHLLY